MRPGVVDAPPAAPTGTVLVICRPGAATAAGIACSPGGDK